MSGSSANAGQAEFWTRETGPKWAENAERLDAAFAPVNDALVNALEPLEGCAVLDIGCGAGASSAALAERAAQVCGLDISPTLLARARERFGDRPNLRFVEGDAQTDDLGEAVFDRAASRFGVMFFSDPVAAFANIRRALKPGAKMALATWAPFKENPWFTIPRFAATDRLGRPAPFDPRAPGPFAFAEADYALSILLDAGFSAEVETVSLLLTPQGDAEEVADLATRIGPAQSVLREMGGTEEDFRAIRAAVAERFADFATPEGIRVPARIHLFQARA